MKKVFIALFLLLSGINILRAQPTSVGYFNPVISPDGKRIVFEADKTGKFAIYTIRTDGTDLQKLTDDNGGSQARWSPDGKQIVFQSRRDGHSQLYLMNADGSNQHRLTNGTDLDFQPYFSPKGNMIVFHSHPSAEGSTNDIYIIKPDGTGRKKLTDGKANYTAPRWSPDGKKIVFSIVEPLSKFLPNVSNEAIMKMSNEERMKIGIKQRNSSELYIMNSDGTNVLRLTNNERRDDQPEWSKDSKTIYFMSERDGPVNLYSMKPDGTAVKKIADGKVIHGSNISSDGQYFVHEKEVNDKSGIYIYNNKTREEKLVIEG